MMAILSNYGSSPACKTLLEADVTFENEFFKDLTEQFSDDIIKNQPEIDGTAFVRLRSVNVKNLIDNGMSVKTMSLLTKDYVSSLCYKYLVGTVYGDYDLSCNARNKMLVILGQVVALACAIAAKLGCHDLSQYVRDAANTEV